MKDRVIAAKATLAVTARTVAGGGSVRACVAGTQLFAPAAGTLLRTRCTRLCTLYTLPRAR
eukprot:2155991-Rhodomonas_salina.1